MASPATSRGRRFGKYTLVAKLATGGMAEIFLARLQGAAGFEKLVCIKQILPHLARDQQFVAMFLDEARIAARISHPQVCQVFELGELDGRYYIAMEYLEGVPLASFRRPDLYWMPPDPQLVIGMAIQACEGLHHAHQLRGSDGASLEVVHRDVSPNNLFVTVDGVVKVLDFGIAKVQDASVRTSTGAVKGTYAYMAPEQLRGERLDRRTDVFAMGIVLWETLVQKHLFRRDTDFLTFQAITTDPIPDVCEMRPDIPPAVGEAIARAMSRDRELRFPTVRALGEALAAAVAPLGGPLPASAVSEEVARAFPGQLREQQKLIHLAQTGGALDLEDDVGPVLSHGTEMLTTPISSLQRGPNTVVLPAPTVPPIPRSSSLVTIVLVAIIALAIGGVALFLWSDLWSDREVAAVKAPGDALVAHVSIDAAAAAAAPIDAVAEVTVAPVDAALVVMTPPTDAADPVDAAVTIATHTDSHPPRVQSPPPVVKGPPGFITIDSTPVYATIFVDGRRLGDTPLVRVELPAGRHSVRAVSPSGAAQNLAISIESGKTAPTRRIEW